MASRSRVLVLALAATMAATLVAASDAPDIVRFKLRAEHFIVVRGSLGELRNVDFVLDTGATHTVVDRRVARKLGLAEVGSTAAVSLDRTLEVSRSRLPELAIGNIRFDPVEALVGNLSFLSPAGSIAAVVGMDLLGPLGLSVDYRKQTVTFGSPAPCDWSVRLEGDFPVPVVRLKIGGVPVRLMVDSGGRDLVLFEDRLPRQVRSYLRPIGDGVLQHGGGQSTARAVRVQEVEIQPNRSATRTAYLVNVGADSYPGLDGVIGATALGGRRVHFDFGRNLLGLMP